MRSEEVMKLTGWQVMVSAIAPAFVVALALMLIMRSNYWAVVGVCLITGMIMIVRHAKQTTTVSAEGVSFIEVDTKRTVTMGWSDVADIRVRKRFGVKKLEFVVNDRRYTSRIPTDGPAYRDPEFERRIEQIVAVWHGSRHA